MIGALEVGVAVKTTLVNVKVSRENLLEATRDKTSFTPQAPKPRCILGALVPGECNEIFLTTASEPREASSLSQTLIILPLKLQYPC